MTIERYEREYIEFHGLSERRAVEGVKTLRQLEDHAGKPLTECGAEEFRAYLNHLLDQGLHVNTVAWRAGMIRPYFGWAFDVGLISGDVLMAVKRVSDPKGATKRTTPKPYTTKELRQFWADLDRAYPWKSSLSLKRWRNGTARYNRIWRHAMRIQLGAITRLALDCGMRRQEIFAATIDDLHYDNFYIVVRNGKRESARVDKEREVPFTKSARINIERWLSFRAELAPHHDSTWLSLWPQIISPSSFGDGSTVGLPAYTQPMRRERFDSLMSTIGPYTLHRFRHTCATNWLRAGVEIEVVSRLLGHANISQTLCYAEIMRDDINTAIHKHEDAFERLVSPKEA